MQKKGIRKISLFLSLFMTFISVFGNGIAYASDEAPDSEQVMETAGETQTEGTTFYTVTLPYSEKWEYGYDKLREKEKNPDDTSKDIVLFYEKDEKVSIMLQQVQDVQITEVSFQDKEDNKTVLEVKEGNIEWDMPDHDIRLIIEAGSIEAEPETTLFQEDAEDAGEAPMPETQADGETEEVHATAETEPIGNKDPEPDGEGSTAENVHEQTESDVSEETSETTESESSAETEEADEDGLPKQGSIQTVETITIPYDDWNFDVEKDFTGINYDRNLFAIEYVSDDIIYTEPGTYTSLYRVTAQDSGKFWFVLRPVVVLEKEKTEAYVKVVKKDADTGESIPVEGAKFQVLDEAGIAILMPDAQDPSKTTDTFSCNGEGVMFLPEPLLEGTYLLKEIQAQEGFMLADPVVFEVAESHSSEEPLEVVCSAMPQEGSIHIQTEGEDGENTGAGFRFDIIVAEDILDTSGKVRTMEIDGQQTELKAGTVVAAAETDESGTARIEGLYLGVYTIEETASGEYYAVNNAVQTVALTYDRDVASVEVGVSVGVEKTGFDMYKVDSVDGEKALAGITFRLVSSEDIARWEEETGNTFDMSDRATLSTLGKEYVTDEAGHFSVSGLKHSASYYILETAVIEGYNPDTMVHEFSVDGMGLINGEARYALKTSNVANLVEISKKTIDDEELPGATLVIRDQNGNVIDTWVSETTAHKVSGLAAGTYVLSEEQAPTGYSIAENIEFTLTDSFEVQCVTMYDELIKVAISKKDVAGKGELPGATLTLKDAAGSTVEEWVTVEDPHVMNLAAGEYDLEEKTAPAGYAKAEPIHFVVDVSREIQQVVMYDQLIQVSISKKDITNDEELPGAHLIIRNSEGENVADWVTGTDPYRMNLAAGKYILIEVTAPDGYEIAESIEFEVTDSMDVQQCTMYDSPKEATVDLTGKTDTKTVKKSGGSSGTSTQATGGKADVVKTGDDTNFTAMIALLLAGIAGMAGGIFSYRRFKKVNK